MTDIPFHTTRMGHTYYEHTLPELVRQLERLNETLERHLETQKEPKDDEDVHPAQS